MSTVVSERVMCGKQWSWIFRQWSCSLRGLDCRGGNGAKLVKVSGSKASDRKNWPAGIAGSFGKSDRKRKRHRGQQCCCNGDDEDGIQGTKLALKFFFLVSNLSYSSPIF